MIEVLTPEGDFLKLPSSGDLVVVGKSLPTISVSHASPITSCMGRKLIPT